MASGREQVLIDTGVLVALLNAGDARHAGASDWLAACDAQLHTVEAVLAESAFFLPPAGRAALADLAGAGTIRVHSPGPDGHRRVAAILRKYADLDPDWADASLVWLAEQRGAQRIATLDVRDFSALRIHGRSKFFLEPIA